MSLNKILSDADRANFMPEVELMNQACPAMMSRKIQDAVVQQAFVLNTIVYQFAIDFQKQHGKLPTILNAGSWEDTAGETLKHLGYQVTDVDPVVNTDLHTFRVQTERKFDAAISTSVLEHTENDEEFIADTADLLYPGGIAVFTCDFLNGWQPGQGTPTTSRRFYTASDLERRLCVVLRDHGCDLLDTPDYTHVDRFYWEGYTYSFATFVFRKSM